ncbi:hypothetical protein ANO14919_140570 [Xylariales sp. No.14919]|nr:hypothetical protein ANO14919_140570 [Xylariales sp. No.14919]
MRLRLTVLPRKYLELTHGTFALLRGYRKSGFYKLDLLSRRFEPECSQAEEIFASPAAPR